uniref:Putative helicase n=2 Tax=viral metagenome TaxID=1070528 RepID=A0A6M3J5M4_9ZZZZ
MSVLFQPGQVAELRFPTRRGWGGGWFDDLSQLAAAAKKASDAGARSVYVTLNPVKPALLARCANRVQEQTKTATSDNDILTRRWLPIDLDPVRPADVSATDEEHEAALEMARQLSAWLTARSWPEPVMADSGNGAHLLYAIDLPNDDEARTLVQRCLEALSTRWSDERISLDVKNFNAARIWKCYGTWARKGDNMPDRPHRLSRILSAPSEARQVPHELLMELADSLPAAPARAQTPGQAFDLPEWVRKSGLQVVADGSWGQGGHRWVLERCPFNADHANRSAVILQHPSGAASFSCLHNSCAGRDWAALRELVEPGWRERANGKPRQEAPPRPEEPQGTIQASDILSPRQLAARYDEYVKSLSSSKILLGWPALDRQLRGVGPGEVLTVIAKSRVGKTAFLQNVLLNIGRRRSTSTLFCSMEQPAQQVFERYAQLAMEETGQAIEEEWIKGGVSPEGITLAVVEALGEHTLTCDVGGLRVGDIEQAVVYARDRASHPLGLVAIDYLGLIDGSNLDRTLYGQTSRIVRELKNLAKRQRIAVMLLCQVSRAPGDDGSQPLTVNSARESGAIEESADFLLGLYRPKIGAGTTDDHIMVQVLKNRKGLDGNEFKFQFQARTLTIGTESLVLDQDSQEEPGGWARR